MGNRPSNDRGHNVDVKSSSVQNLKNETSREFVKSQSMGELGRAAKRKKNSFSRESTDKSKPPSRNGSTVARQKSIRRDIAHPISAQGREIIVLCFENPHSEFGNKTCQRIFEKRADFQSYVFTLGKEKAFHMTVRLKELVEEVVARIDDVDHISALCRRYGEEHVELKAQGFKPDFWVALADAITLEGVILDMATHQPADTVAAWSQLVTLMFSSVRDGYYTALRAHRMSCRRSNGMRRQTTNDSASSGDPSLSPATNGHAPAIRSASMYSIENGPKQTPIFE